MTTQTLIAVFTVLWTLALAAERFIEIFKPLIEKISIVWQPSVKIVLAIAIGSALAALFRFDLLKELAVFGVIPVIGYVLAGLVASAGSSVIHPVLEWLKTLKNDTTTTVTKKTSEGSESTEVVATTVTNSQIPIEETPKAVTIG